MTNSPATALLALGATAPPNTASIFAAAAFLPPIGLSPSLPGIPLSIAGNTATQSSLANGALTPFMPLLNPQTTSATSLNTQGSILNQNVTYFRNIQNFTKP